MTELSSDQHRAVGELITKIKELLARFADRQHAAPGTDRTGVQVLYNKVQRNLIMFRLTTHDQITADVKFDLNAVSRKYIDNMVRDVRDLIVKRRQQRQGQAIMVPKGFGSKR